MSGCSKICEGIKKYELKELAAVAGFLKIWFQICESFD